MFLFYVISFIEFKDGQLRVDKSGYSGELGSRREVKSVFYAKSSRIQVPEAINELFIGNCPSDLNDILKGYAKSQIGLFNGCIHYLYILEN